MIKIIKKIVLRLIILIVVVAIIVGFAMVMINSHVQSNQRDNILCAISDSKDGLLSSEIDTLKNFNGDCILILGAGIKDENTPSKMLKDRLDTGIMLYNLGVCPKILLSGDNGTLEHNEIHVMLNYCIKAGVPKEDIFCDHAGFSTYDSMYRAIHIFQVSKVVVVTQTYHEYRALYIGEKLGLSVIGVGSDQKTYSGQSIREIREVIARDKDFFKVMVKPESQVGGDAIPITGDGSVSHGE